MAAFSVSTALLDAVVLACVAQGDTYGYELTHQIQSVFSISESTLYPVLRRLQKNEYLQTYDQPYQGRNAGITTSPMPDGRLWKPTAPSGSSTNNKLTNF